MLNRLLGILVLSVALGAGWFWLAYQQFLEQPLSLSAEGVVYQVKPGTSLKQLAHDLSAQGLIEQPDFLSWYARYTGQANKIKAGEYRLAPGLTPPALLDLLVSGKTTRYQLTLVEGWNFQQVRAAVAGDPVLIKTLEGLADGEVMARLGHAGEHHEGRFFPDTYQFPRGTTDLSLLRRAYQRMEKVLAEEWQQREKGLPLENAYQALILASVIEKETGAPEERAQIAGVFMRRLRKGMRLQTDPTVIYGLGDGFDGNLRRRDLKQDTPYNSYTRKGLPPTPICMPGREAIHAALHPAPGDALYFVAKGDGTHQFSATLQQHNAAVRKHQLKR